MKTNKKNGNRKVSGKKNNSRLKNKKRTRFRNTLIGGSDGPLGSLGSLGSQGSQRTKLVLTPRSLSPRSPNQVIENQKTQNKIMEQLFNSKFTNFTSNSNRDLTPEEKELRYLKIEIEKFMEENNIVLAEITNSFLQIRYTEPTKKNNTVPTTQNNTVPETTNNYYFAISLDKLSVDKLQYYINNNKISLSHDDYGEYLGINENTLLIETTTHSDRYKTGASSDFVDVYEGIEGVEGFEMIPYDINLDKMKENYFQIKIFLSNKKDKVFSNKKDTLSDTLSDKGFDFTQIDKNISWLNNVYVDLNTKQGDKKKIDLFLESFNTSNTSGITTETKIFECEDLNVDHTKLIIDDGIDDGPNKLIIDGEQYVIIGYPDKSMKPYIESYNKNKEEFEAIYKDHKTNFMKYMAELHNAIQVNKDKDENQNIIDTAKLQEEIHKFYGYGKYYQYVSDFYENELKTLPEKQQNTANQSKPANTSNTSTPLYQSTQPKPINEEYGISYDTGFKKKFEELQKAFYNELASKCLNKPMMKINYNFLIFKKKTTENEYVPAIFNFKELTHKHYRILKRLEFLIKKRLAKIYGIIDNKTEKDYKLWYSHYNYGDVFHIKTEYVHAMSNIQQQAYKYKNSISLEEIIYMLSIYDVDLKKLRIDYQIKQFYFSKREIQTINGVPKIKKTIPALIPQKIVTIRKCYQELPKTVIPKSLILETHLKSKDTKILLMFVETGNIYNFVYKNGEQFYKLKLKPNLCSVYDEKIKNKNFFEMLIGFTRGKKHSKFTDLSNIKSYEGYRLYKVLEHRLIIFEDYKAIMTFNPVLVRTISKTNNADNTINVSTFFQSPLVDLTLLTNSDMTIPNPYTKKPLLIRNFLTCKEYRDEFKTFKDKYATKKEHEYISEPETIHTQDLNKYLFTFLGPNYEKKEINKIYFNPEQCKFNLIEIKEKNKRVIWVVPFNATHNESINDSFDGFDGFDGFDDDINKPKYINNFMNLNNKNHIKVLEIIKNKYMNKDYECFLNIASITPQQVCLHIHIMSTGHYKSIFSSLEQGSKIEKMLNIVKVINFLKLNITYYDNFKCDILLHDKI